MHLSNTRLGRGEDLMGETVGLESLSNSRDLAGRRSPLFLLLLHQRIMKYRLAVVSDAPALVVLLPPSLRGSPLILVLETHSGGDL